MEIAKEEKEAKEENKIIYEEILCEGEVNPPPLFGHSCALISKAKVAMFGGATGEKNKFTMVNDLYLFNLFKSEWIKIDSLI